MAKGSADKIKSACTNCGNVRSVSSKYVGKKIKCKECDQSYRIVAEEDNAAESEEIHLTPEDTATASARVAKKKGRGKEVTDDMMNQYSEDISPDALMGDFKGKGIIGIFLVTIILHVVVLGGSSYGYIQKEFFSPAPEEIDVEKRKDMALDDATVALREIAEKYNLKSADITDKFSKGGSRGSKVGDSKATSPKSNDSTKNNPEGTNEPKSNPDDNANSTPEASGNTEENKSALEKSFDKKEQGPEDFDFNDDF